MVERYITLTDFAKQLFVNSSLGITADKFITKPNFVSAGPATIATRGSHLLFVGRLTQEKGVHVLLKAFSGTAYVLRIAGDGPLKGKVVETAQDRKSTRLNSSH